MRGELRLLVERYGHMKTCVWLALLWVSASGVSGGSFSNGGFEAGLAGWGFWTREAGAGSATIETRNIHTGKQAARIEHRGDQDWSFEPQDHLTVQPGELYEVEAWFRAEGEGRATLCASTWNAAGEVLEWSYAARTVRSGGPWQHLRTRLMATPGMVRIQPRVIGAGKLTVWVDDFSVRKVPSPVARVAGGLKELVISNRFLQVVLDPAKATLAVTDRRTGRTWNQAVHAAEVLLQEAAARGKEIRMKLYDAPSGLETDCRVRLERAEPEFTVEMAASGELAAPMRFPHPFATAAGDWLVIPMNEGISYPVEDRSIELHRLIAYGGHGIGMAFWGVTDGQAGHMCIIETPDDAAIQMLRVEGKLAIAPEWDPQKHAFGYPRRLRYVFFDRGGHVAMAKRYRAYAQKIGIFRTLAEKRKRVPAVDQLIGAVNVWCWDQDAPGIVREMRAAGIERILWSNQQKPEALRILNEAGVLTSRYDIYQDVMDPDQFSQLRWVHPDWPRAAWPRDLMIDAEGRWIKGWGVEAKDGSMISCGVLCDRQALAYARERVAADLVDHPYRCRFIDTTTASPWRECYSPEHPMTRSESRKYKMELLRYMSQDRKLVTGSETGHDAAVPYVDYFEGMLSLGPYRVPDAGRRVQQIWTEAPERVAKFQLGQYYRLPLWELVFHDCVVAQWYWGDYNNKLPALWDKRDLFNVLYGTPPMFMFDRRLWNQQKDRFARSYSTVCPLVREVGYAEMTEHRFLTPDRAVQQTVFSSGHRVTVNFGSTEFDLGKGGGIAPMSYRVEKP